jgi:hypothetical protein
LEIENIRILGLAFAMGVVSSDNILLSEFQNGDFDDLFALLKICGKPQQKYLASLLASPDYHHEFDKICMLYEFCAGFKADSNSDSLDTLAVKLAAQIRERLYDRKGSIQSIKNALIVVKEAPSLYVEIEARLPMLKGKIVNMSDIFDAYKAFDHAKLDVPVWLEDRARSLLSEPARISLDELELIAAGIPSLKTDAFTEFKRRLPECAFAELTEYVGYEEEFLCPWRAVLFQRKDEFLPLIEKLKLG